jgi:prenyltransferase beta subunit
MNIGSTNTSYNALYSLFHMGFKNVPKKSAEWILNLENVEGGFAPITGLNSRLSNTYEALSILNEFDMLKKVKIETHVKWIRELQKEKGFFNDPISRYPEIEQTFYALQSLNLLGQLDAIEKKKCTDWVKKIWKIGRRDYGSVYHSLKCLELLGELNESMKKEMIDEWISPYTPVLKNLSIDRNLTSFFYYFRIAEIVIGNREEIKGLIPGIEEKVYNSLIDYLEKR